jgi:hypothetical protein
MAAPVQVETAAAVPGFLPPERDLARSEEEEKLLKKIREEKERLWCEIQDLRRQIIDIDNELGALDEANDEEIRMEKEKQRVMRTGRNKFNTSPKEGVKFLQAQGRLQESAEAVAQFLFKGELLNKRKIGDYLGEGYVSGGRVHTCSIRRCVSLSLTLCSIAISHVFSRDVCKCFVDVYRLFIIRAWFVY